MTITPEDTRAWAFAEAQDRLADLQLIVLGALMEGPATDEELSARTGLYHNTSNATRRGLVERGLVRSTGGTRLSQRDHPMIVWELVPAGEKGDPVDYRCGKRTARILARLAEMGDEWAAQVVREEMSP